MRVSRISEKHSVLNGRAEIYRTSTAGDVWQFRFYDLRTKKQIRKSLKTRDLKAALEAAEEMVGDLAGGKATKTQKRISSQHKVLDGMATIYRTSASGDVWQFQMYFQDEQKYYRKSLRTRDLDAALEKARQLGADLIGMKRQGIKIFGMSLQQLVDEWVEYKRSEVALGIMAGITAERLITIRSQLKHLLAYKGAATKCAELERDSLFEYELMAGIGIEDHQQRKLTWYSLRHWMITQRIAAGVNVVDLAKITGTSISHIEQTYLKYSQEMAREAALKSFRFTEDGGIERY